MFTRYAIYYTSSGDLANAGAAWLGWDVAQGRVVEHPVLADLDVAGLTEAPRKYGFHATLKPPMVLQDATTPQALQSAFEVFCQTHASVILDGLAVSQMGRFFALTPVGEGAALRALAAEIVADFDTFRAAPSAAELERRRAVRLSKAQDANLVKWGYPYVMDQFRFHMTLTGRVKTSADIADAIETFFEPTLPRPFILDHLTLVGQRADGMFAQITRHPLSG